MTTRQRELDRAGTSEHLAKNERAKFAQIASRPVPRDIHLRRAAAPGATWIPTNGHPQAGYRLSNVKPNYLSCALLNMTSGRSSSSMRLRGSNPGLRTRERRSFPEVDQRRWNSHNLHSPVRSCFVTGTRAAPPLFAARRASIFISWVDVVIPRLALNNNRRFLIAFASTRQVDRSGRKPRNMNSNARARKLACLCFGPAWSVC